MRDPISGSIVRVFDIYKFRQVSLENVCVYKNPSSRGNAKAM